MPTLRGDAVRGGPDDMSGEPIGRCRKCGGDIFAGSPLTFADAVCEDVECRARAEWVEQLVEFGEATP